VTQPAQDSWAALSIPTQAGYTPFVPIAQDEWHDPSEVPLADPTLAVCLDFLATAINRDALTKRAWEAVRSAAKGPPLKRIFAHNPKDVVFNEAHLPALYIWRETSASAYQADDWYVDTTPVKGLWVFPLGAQVRQKQRQPFVNALMKAMELIIERGRTPGWIQPTDTDTRSPIEGSVFYPYAGFESFFLRSWRRDRLTVDDGGATYPCIEITFDLEENLVYGLDRFYVNAGVTATLYDASGTLPWQSLTLFTTTPKTLQVTPTPGNGFIYTCTTEGVTANVQPLWPTDIGDTVEDGTVIWTCTSAMQPNGNITVSGPLDTSS
jgi:hypothetical protein